LGSAIAEYKTQFENTPSQLTIGLPDIFLKTGEYRYLLEKYGLVADKIANSIINKLKNK